MNGLVVAMADIVRPLHLALLDEDQLAALMGDLGWAIDVDASPLEAFGEVREAVGMLVAAGQKLALEAGGGGGLTGAELAQLLKEAKGLFAALGSRTTGVASYADPVFARPDFWTSLYQELPEYLLLRWLSSHQPVLHGALRVVRVIVDVEIPGSDDGVRSSHTRAELRVERIVELVSNPDYLPQVWGFTGTGADGTPVAFDHAALTAELEVFLRVLGVPVRRVPVRDVFYGAADRPFAALPAEVFELDVPIVAKASGGASFEAGVILLPVPAADGDAENAIILTNLSSGAFRGELKLNERWTGSVDADVDVSGVVGLEVQPSDVVPFGSLRQENSVKVELRGRASDEAPWRLFGVRDGTRLEIRRLEASATLSTGTVVDGEIRVALPHDAADPGVRMVIDTADGDGFVGKLIGGEPLILALGAEIGWSSSKGFSFTSGAGLTFTRELDQQLGPLTIERVELGLDVDAASRRLGAVATTDVAAQFGPCHVRVTGVGVRCTLEEAVDGRGLLGPLDLSFRFEPPTGAGLSIEAPGVTGGGFLELEPEIGRYTGMLALQTPAFGFGAIGIVTAKPKDPQLAAGWTGPDFSLFLGLFATFKPPIQLGFGFGLGGVGGMFAANRRMDPVAVRAAVRAGSLDAVLFPDPATIVEDAPRILGTIESIFPIQEGSFVFGPMLQITYGAPDPLVTAMLGVFVSLPEPVVVALLGRVQLLLPNPSDAVLELNMDVAGVLDFGEGQLSLDAKIHDSTLLAFALTGEMAMRLRWKGEPTFLLSVGGFHPAFEPPADIGKLERMGLAMDFTCDVAEIHLGFQGYFALTPNTLQFGSALFITGSLDAELFTFDLEGYAGFDALMVFEPFSFRTDITAYLTLRAGGTELAGVAFEVALEGPRPCWSIEGKATFTFLGKEFSKDFAAYLGGDEQRRSAAPAEVHKPLLDVLDDDRSWQEGEGLDSLVRLRDLTAQEKESHAIWARPDGSMEVRQRLIPFGLKLEQLGPVEPRQGQEGPYALEGRSVQGGKAVACRSSALLDHFAPAAYLDLAEDERLTARSFERMPAGIAFGDTCLSLPPEAHLGASATLTWERKAKGGKLPAARPGKENAGHSRAQAQRRRGAQPQAALRLSIEERAFRLIDTDTASAAGEQTGTWTEVRHARKVHAGTDPSKRAAVTIAPVTPRDA